MDIAGRLKSLREDAGYKQSDILERFSISSARYSQYETGKRKPDYELLVEFAKFYDVSTDYLLGCIDTPYHTEKIANIFGRKSKKEQEIIKLIHMMDEPHREKVADYANYIYENYKNFIEEQRKKVNVA